MIARHAASTVTIGRIAGALVLLAVPSLGVAFYIVYGLCCLSDVADGPIARRNGTTSTTGEILDSVADLILIAVMAIILIPRLAWQPWMIWWVGGIAVLKIATTAIGFAKFRVAPFWHTRANKAAGVALALAPFVYPLLGLVMVVLVVGVVASLAAVEELAITAASNRINRNMPGFLIRRKMIAPAPSTASASKPLPASTQASPLNGRHAAQMPKPLSR